MEARKSMFYSFSYNRILSMEAKLLDLNQEMLNLKTNSEKTNHELAESVAKLSISRNETSSLLKENEILRDRGNLNIMIENRLEKVISVLSSKEEKEISQLRIEMADLKEVSFKIN